jgi:hypothetical protein
MAWAWRHSTDGLAPCWVAEKLQPHTHTHRTNIGGVCSKVQSTEGHFITPLLLSLVADEFIEGLNEMAVIQWGMCYPHN